MLVDRKCKNIKKKRMHRLDSECNTESCDLVGNVCASIWD
jgi:hypothetical protein